MTTAPLDYKVHLREAATARHALDVLLRDIKGTRDQEHPVSKLQHSIGTGLSVLPHISSSAVFEKITSMRAAIEEFTPHLPEYFSEEKLEEVQQALERLKSHLGNAGTFVSFIPGTEISAANILAMVDKLRESNSTLSAAEGAELEGQPLHVLALMCDPISNLIYMTPAWNNGPPVSNSEKLTKLRTSQTRLHNFLEEARQSVTAFSGFNDTQRAIATAILDEVDAFRQRIEIAAQAQTATTTKRNMFR